MDGLVSALERILRMRGSQPLKGKRIGVVGGGLGGDAAAYEATNLGAEAMLFEARKNRGGGRVRTYKTFGGDTWVEGGPEFIGEQHLEWRHYADLFGLKLTKAEDYYGPFSPVIPYSGHPHFTPENAKKLTEHMSLAVPLFNRYAATVNVEEPWNSPTAQKLDYASVFDILVDAADVDLLSDREEVEHGSGTLLDALCTQIEANQGDHPRQISALGYSTQVAAHGIEKFWKDTESYRCEGGVDQLTSKFQEALGDRIRFGAEVTKIVQDRKSVTVHAKDRESFTFDHVIVAVPAALLKRITFEPALPPEFYLSSGRNTKFFAPVRADFPVAWGLNPLAIMHNGKGRLQLIWEATAGQNRNLKVITGFSGGDDARYLSNLDPAAARNELCLNELELLMPGIREALVGDVHFKNWPLSEFTGGGYSCPAPGDVTTKWKAISAGFRRIRFAGEAYSWRYWGFMNGALESALRAIEALATLEG